jgi:hypothetical protein
LGPGVFKKVKLEAAQAALATLRKKIARDRRIIVRRMRSRGICPAATALASVEH